MSEVVAKRCPALALALERAGAAWSRASARGPGRSMPCLPHCRELVAELDAARRPSTADRTSTTPARGERTSFSIFMASMASRRCPASTVSPTATHDRTTRPGIGARTTAGPCSWRPHARDRRPARAGAPAPPAPRRPGSTPAVDGDLEAARSASRADSTARAARRGPRAGRAAVCSARRSSAASSTKSCGDSVEGRPAPSTVSAELRRHGHRSVAARRPAIRHAAAGSRTSRTARRPARAARRRAARTVGARPDVLRDGRGGAPRGAARGCARAPSRARRGPCAGRRHGRRHDRAARRGTGSVVWTPPVSNSATARRARARAPSRSSATTRILARRES